MSNPNVGINVEKQIEKRLDNMRVFNWRFTRQSAAVHILSEKPGWYKQTPEGEYLIWVASEKSEKTS